MGVARSRAFGHPPSQRPWRESLTAKDAKVAKALAGTATAKPARLNDGASALCVSSLASLAVEKLRQLKTKPSSYARLIPTGQATPVPPRPQ